MSDSIIRSLGAGSGINVTSLVDGLVAAEKAPQENRLNSRQESLNTQISAYGNLKSSLSEFQSLLAPLSSSDTFNARSVAFPTTDLITANQLDANAQVGSFQIEVLDVARSQSLSSAAVADPDAALGAGDVTFRFGSWTSYTELGGPVGFSQNADKDALTVSLDADDSLNDMVSKINDADVGLQASVISNGGQYQLLITTPSGNNNAIEITADPVLSQFSFKEGDAQLTQNQSANDASLKVNGLQISRESNDIDDVISGLSFTVNKAAIGEPISFSISEDKGVGEQAIRSFVEGYNTLYKTLSNLTGTSRDAETNEVVVGGLSTDGSAKGLVRQIRQTLTDSVAGVDSSFSALTNIGVRTALDGSLEIIEDDFNEAMKSSYDKVADLFSESKSTNNGNISLGFGSYINQAKAGTYEVDITQEPTKGSLNGASGAGFTASFPLDTGAGSQYTFTISVDGTASNQIILPDNKVYANEQELASELQSLINGDSNLKGVNATLDVTFDATDGRFEFVSRSYGSSSVIKMDGASVAMDTLGINSSLVGTGGVNVEGTINGEAGFGSGNVLLPKVGSDSYGINLTVEPGSLGKSQFTFGRGLASELSVLIDNATASNGVVDTREKNINSDLEGIVEDKKELEVRMEKFQARLISQFTAMESIISSLQQTGNSLTGIIDRLPFTSKN